MHTAINTLLTFLVLTVVSLTGSAAETVRVAVVQTSIEDTVADNCQKMLRFVVDAKASECQLIVFPENMLYWPEYSKETPTKEQLDNAIDSVRASAKEHGIFVAFGSAYRESETEKFRNKAFIFGPTGEQVLAYKKSVEVPPSFKVNGVRCNLLICSDRWYLEMSDLPCLVDETQLIFDISGGHGGDDGRPDLPLIRYRPWAIRTGAWVIVSNPVHDDTDFMGHSPWGGGSAVIRPDGSIMAHRRYEKDDMIVAEIDPEQAQRTAAHRRRNHPLFRTFWDSGHRLLCGKSIEAGAEVISLPTTPGDVRVAVAQMICGRSLSKNLNKVLNFISQAAGAQAEVVLFPELALTGTHPDDLTRLDRELLNKAVESIQREARARRIHIIVGAPLWKGETFYNGAIVIDDEGHVKTRYAQIAPRDADLFAAGTDLRSMWFDLNGVPAIVTIGHDADWIEIPDLAACRGMSLHFHLTNEVDHNEDQAVIRRQRELLALSYAQLGAVANAVREDVEHESIVGGGSLIVSRVGGHNQPAPDGVEYYLPYQTSILKSASTEESLLAVTQRMEAQNPLGAIHYRNRNRRYRKQQGWDHWIRQGTRLIRP